MVATLLTPASSPGRRSIVSMEKLFFSAHILYILSSIDAQSHDSVPPAPACILRNALQLSFCPFSIIRNSSFSSFWVNDCRSFAISASNSSSLSSSSASSDKSTTSLSDFRSSWKGMVNSFNSLSLFMVDCAFSLSFQKSAFPNCVSISSCSFSLEFRSKRVP